MAGRAAIRRWRRVYGAHPLHLLVLVAAFVVLIYNVSWLGFDALWNRQVWWQSIAVWFAAAIIAHDLVLFPIYSLFDRALVAMSGRVRLPISPLNYLRLPLLGIALSFVLFFPGIVEQGATTYHAATGTTQQPFLRRWLLLSAGILIVAALTYAVRVLALHRKATRPAPPRSGNTGPADSEEGHR